MFCCETKARRIDTHTVRLLALLVRPCAGPRSYGDKALLSNEKEVAV